MYIYIDVYFKSSPLCYNKKFMPKQDTAFAKIEFTTYISVVSLRTSLTLIQPFNGCMESLIGFSLLHFYHYPLFIQHSVRKHWSLSCMNNF